MEETKMRALVLSCLLAFGIVRVAIADTEENAEDFMAIHKIEIAFHEAGTTKNLNLMLSLFSDDATIHAHPVDTQNYYSL